MFLLLSKNAREQGINLNQQAARRARHFFFYIYADNAKSTRVVVVRLSPALPSLVVCSKTEAKINVN